jgi:pyridoxal phosphate enzyme (YggS family)
MGIAENLSRLRQEIPPHVKIVAVSKTMPLTAIMEAYGAGHRIFGENRVQELIEKQNNLPPDIEWHLIGHLQTNKVKYIVPFVRLIHAVDSLKLLAAINNEALRLNRVVDCLLQLKIAKEVTKFGLTFEGIRELLNSAAFADFKNIRICGLMGMATFTNDEWQIREEFRYLADCFKDLKSTFFRHVPGFAEMSIGMSGDYNIAIQTGATILRIGSLIFGERKKQS